MIKEFIIFKNTKQTDNQKAPTHKIMAKVNGENLVEIGVGWSRESKNGNKFLSCVLQKAWVDHTDRSKTRIGFAIANEKDITTDKTNNTPPEAQNEDLNVF